MTFHRFVGYWLTTVFCRNVHRAYGVLEDDSTFRWVASWWSRYLAILWSHHICCLSWNVSLGPHRHARSGSSFAARHRLVNFELIGIGSGITGMGGELHARRSESKL